MNLIYSALMLHEAKKEINEENVKKIVKSVGIEVDDAQIKALVAALEGVDIEDAISKSVVAAAPVSGATSVESGKEAKSEEKEEEQDEEAAEEEAAAGLAGLFG